MLLTSVAFITLAVMSRRVPSGGKGDGKVGISRRLGYIGFGGLLGAAVVLPAAAANASGTYNSTATASAGSVSIAGNPVPVPDNTVTATNGNSPQSAALGLGQLESALASTPLAGSLTKVAPDGANLVTETATASADGKSTACAGFLAGDCAAGHAHPITISLSLADLPGLKLPSGGNSASSDSSKSGPSSGSGGSTSGTPVSGLVSGVTKSLPSNLPSLPGTGAGTGAGAGPAGASGSKASPSPSTDPATALAGYALVLAISGPEAACTAGPAGGPGADFTATQRLAAVTVSVEKDGKVIASSTQLAGPLDNILSKLPMPSQLQNLLGASTLPASPIGLTINPGSTSGAGSGPVTKATAGELALSVNGTPVLKLVGAQATCGPDKQVRTTAKTRTAPERPLGGGIQTDEGRSGSGDIALWLGVIGGAALAGGTGGMLWRRRHP